MRRTCNTRSAVKCERMADSRPFFPIQIAEDDACQSIKHNSAETISGVNERTMVIVAGKWPKPNKMAARILAIQNMDGVGFPSDMWLMNFPSQANRVMTNSRSRFSSSKHP